MLTSELDYHLPDGLIARRPAEPRDSCRLLVVSRSDPAFVEHRTFRDLPDYLRPGDLMVFNTSGVLPAKVQGKRAETGAAVEGLFIRAQAPGAWELMLKTGTKLRPGTVLELDDAGGRPTGIGLRLGDRADERWLAAVIDIGTGDVTEKPEGEVLAKVGATPLPPYIRRARKDAGDETADEQDRAWYQCVYAEGAESGGGRSVAAPTAGLHFTPELLEKLKERGVGRADVRLQVGIGTFKPVEVERVEDHPIHGEWIDVPASTVTAVERARASGNRVVAVGTTAVRTLESLPWPMTDDVRSGGLAAETSLFVTPGFEFRQVDALVTNFHLPRSTLLAMVGALFEGSGGLGESGGVKRLLEIYRMAVREKYRFYSYGDAMLVLP